MVALITAPIVAGRCPFNTEAPPAAGVTPATHFALARGPASDTAVLLRFATHRWHSRLVAALKEDAAAQGSLATAEQFVLVVPPEPIRGDVVPVLVELLELRRMDPRFDSGVSQNCAVFDALLDAAFPEPDISDSASDSDSSTADSKSADGGRKRRNPSLHSPFDVAAVSQLCRLGEFLQCNTITNAAVNFLDAWLDSVTDSGQDPTYVRLMLRLLCSADIGPASSAEDQFEEADPIPWYGTPPVDLEFMRTLVNDGDDCVIGYFNRSIAPRVRAYMPPCAIPRRVAAYFFASRAEGESRRQSQEGEHDDWEQWLQIACGRRTDLPSYLFVNGVTAVEDYPDCILHFFSADHLAPFLDSTAKGVVLPPNCDVDTVFKSELLFKATYVSFPDDFDDTSLGRIDQTSMQAKVLQMSNTKITTIPPHWCAHDGDVEHVHFPPTLKRIGPGAFAHCPKLRVVTGLEGVDVAPTAFSNTDLGAESFMWAAP